MQKKQIFWNNKIQQTFKNIQIDLYLYGAGCGKSYLINQMNDCVKIAPTNLQCKLINGSTIYTLTKSPINKLKCNNTIFPYKLVVIDEVFMYGSSEFAIILQCCQQDTHLVLFGDPYQQDFIQSKKTKNDFFYNCLQNFGIDVNQIKLHYSQTNYRIKDQKLLNLLQQYRENRQSGQTHKDFQQIILEDAIDKVIEQNAIILCGTHRRCDYFTHKICQRSKNKQICTDGRIWFKGQRVFYINQNGSLQQQQFVEDFIYDQQSQQWYIQLQDKNIMKPHLKKNKYQYDIVHGISITIQAVQGQTIKSIVILDLKSFISFGSYYVGISRCEKWEDIYIISNNKQTFIPNLLNRFVK